MLRIPLKRNKPEPWPERRRKIPKKWMVPFVWLEQQSEWAAYVLSHWTFLEVLEYLSSFGVLIAVVFYFAESGDRLKQKHYQAWQVINTAQGKGGNGGRIDALEELNEDKIPLIGVDLQSAFLQGIHLKKVNLSRANFAAADARDADLLDATIENASLRGANFRNANFAGASLQGSTLDDADFSGANLSGVNLADATADNLDLHSANLENLEWRRIKSLKGANLFDVKNAPPGFLEWALHHGAIATE